MSQSINLDIAKRVDITCRRGDTFTISLTFNDENGDNMILNTHFFKMTVKETDTTVADVIEFDEFTYSIDPENVVTVTAQYDVMETKPSGSYVYDLQSKDGLVVRTWIYGIFKINEDVSQT